MKIDKRLIGKTNRNMFEQLVKIIATHLSNIHKKFKKFKLIL